MANSFAACIALSGSGISEVMADDVNQHKRRCPRLGHDLTFEYCRSAGGELPCRRVFDCWWEIFDVEGWARAHLTEEQIAQLTAAPKPKAVSLYELIRQAQQRTTRPASDPTDFGCYDGSDDAVHAKLFAHAPEIVRDGEQWYITTCGWRGMQTPVEGGVAISQLDWT